jgi:hypothetical protein
LMGFFICLGWLRTVIILISASWLVRITGVSHRCLAPSSHTLPTQTLCTFLVLHISLFLIAYFQIWEYTSFKLCSHIIRYRFWWEHQTVHNMVLATCQTALLNMTLLQST